jgi:hypothetical protein
MMQYRRLIFSVPVFFAANLLFGVSSALAQNSLNDVEHFGFYPIVSQAPGNRAASVKVRRPANNGEQSVWVVYSDDRNAVEQARTINESLSYARASLSSGNGTWADADFIFPHKQHSTPNGTDRNPRVYPHNKTIFYKLFSYYSGTLVSTSQVYSVKLPDPLTIANLGDSYAAGEGAPYSDGPLWESDSDGEKCHRSNNSGQARAVADLIRERRSVAIEFVNFACTGAGIENGLLHSQREFDWGGHFHPRLNRKLIK